MENKNEDIKKCKCGSDKIVPTHIFSDKDKNKFRCLKCGAYIEKKIILVPLR